MSRKDRAQWDKHSEKALLVIWSKNIKRLRACRKNSHIVAEMANELKAQGFNFSVLEIKIKIQNLTSRYRKEKRGIKKKNYVPVDDWDVVQEMDVLFKTQKRNDSEIFAFDSINNINSSIMIDSSPSSMNTSSFPSMLESPNPLSPLKPPDSPSSSDSSSSEKSLPSAKERKKEFEKFFQNLERTVEKINEDITTTVEKMIAIEEEKKEILRKYVEKEGVVQDALLEFLKRN